MAITIYPNNLNATPASIQTIDTTLSPIVPVPAEILRAFEQAMRQRPPEILPGNAVQIISFRQNDNWAIATVTLAPASPDEAGTLMLNAALIIASKIQGQWSAALMGTPAYLQMLNNTPTDFVPANRRAFLSPAKPNVRAPRAIATPLKWFWSIGQQWFYSQGRHGVNNSAIDFGAGGIRLGQRYVRAAADGVVLFQCGPDAGGQINLVLRHNTGAAQDEVTGYVHLDASTVAWNVGDAVKQGDILGQVYGNGTFSLPCGAGTGPHVHFLTGVLPAGSPNAGQITPVDAAGISICGWTLSTDNAFYKSGKPTFYVGQEMLYTTTDCPSTQPTPVPSPTATPPNVPLDKFTFLPWISK